MSTRDMAIQALKDTQEIQGQYLAAGMGNTETVEQKLDILMAFERRILANQSVIMGLLFT